MGVNSQSFYISLNLLMVCSFDESIIINFHIFDNSAVTFVEWTYLGHDKFGTGPYVFFLLWLEEKQLAVTNFQPKFV